MVHQGLKGLPPRESASVELAKHLMDYLLSGEIKPGARIPSERQLMELLGTGRSSIREALKSLTLLGLIEPRQGDGTFLVGSISDLLPQVLEWGLLLGERNLHDLIETRYFLEVHLAGLAASHRTDVQLQELESIFEQMRAAKDDLESYIECDIRFHLAISQASGNSVMANLLVSVRSLLQVWTKKVILGYGRTDFSLSVHEPIVVAIRDGDVAAAKRAMTDHMESAKRHLTEVLDASGPLEP
ncbi:FadR family transcriptional regulator [Micrococcales bacterium 31B]|nr:FadR family transcriptional regulator [Micrococcales bacterium 31B]